MLGVRLRKLLILPCLFDRNEHGRLHQTIHDNPIVSLPFLVTDKAVIKSIDIDPTSIQEFRRIETSPLVPYGLSLLLDRSGTLTRI